MDLVELAPRVSPASDFDDRSTLVKMLEAGICVCPPQQRIVVDVAVQIERLWNVELRVRDRLFFAAPVRAQEPPCGAVVVPSEHVVVAGFGVSFFAGKVWLKTICQSSNHSNHSLSLYDATARKIAAQRWENLPDLDWTNCPHSMRR